MTVRGVLLRSVCLAFVLPAAAMAQTPTATASTTATAPASQYLTREELPAAIKDVFEKDPKLMLDIMKSVHEKQVALAKKETEDGIKDSQSLLFTADEYPSIGPKDADVTFVEFFDYHCGYCKRMLPTLVELTKKDKKVRIIFRDFPILSEDSSLASRAAIAVHRVAPAKYFEYHTALMKMNGKFTEDTLLAAAKKIGIDTKKMKTAMDEKETSKLLDDTQELAAKVGVRGTPALVFKDKLVPGAVPLNDLQQMVDEQRSN